MSIDSLSSGAFESSSSNRNPLDQLKEHVIQIEALSVYTILSICVLFLTSTIDALRSYQWAVACIFLTGIRAVLRVTNPSSGIRNRLTWGTALGGFGAAVGTALGALVDLASFGLTAGAGTAAGLVVGTTTGIAAGDAIENWRNRGQLLERGKAFNYLYERRNKNPALANPNQINKVLDDLPKYDINSDGRFWYTMDDLQKAGRKQKVDK